PHGTSRFPRRTTRDVPWGTSAPGTTRGRNTRRESVAGRGGVPRGQVRLRGRRVRDGAEDRVRAHVDIGDLPRGVDRRLERVAAGRDVRDVDPLAVERAVVDVGPARADPLVVALEA